MLHCFIASANYELKKSACSVLCWGGCSVEITAGHIGSWLPCWVFIPSLSLVEVLSVIIHACVCCLFSRVWLCNAMDCSPPGSSVHGILQARILDRVATSFYRASSWPRIFLTHGSNPHLLCLLHWQADSVPLASPGKPGVLKTMEDMSHSSGSWEVQDEAAGDSVSGEVPLSGS